MEIFKFRFSAHKKGYYMLIDLGFTYVRFMYNKQIVHEEEFNYMRFN